MSTCLKTVLLFGGPGVGKGTQGQILGAIRGFCHCASGDIFRSVDKASELSKTFVQYSSRGELVPDDVTVKMWQQAMHDWSQTGRYDPDADLLILDGIPRTVEQTVLMDGLIEVLKIVHLTCHDLQVMLARLRGRARKENRQDDIDEDIIRNRWEVYERETAPVLEHYPKHLIADIDAVGTPAQVLRHVLDVIAPIQSQHFPVYGG